jgi:hypothetical protein
MMEEGLFIGKDKHELHKVVAPPRKYFTELSRVTFCLELINFAIDDDSKKKLCLPHRSLTPRQVYDLTIGIERLAMDQMWIFEGKDPKIERQNQFSQGGRKRKPTYDPLGKRVYAYKKVIRANRLTNKLSVEDKVSEQPLQNRDELKLEPGQKTMWDFVHGKGNQNAALNSVSEDSTDKRVTGEAVANRESDNETNVDNSK